MTRYYTGVGSRSTPPTMIEAIVQVAGFLADQGYVLRSGAANGADTFWEMGCARAGGPCEIYLPWAGFKGHDSLLVLDTFSVELQSKALRLAKSVHPAWNRLSPAGKKLHMRNVFQVLGRDLATPSERLVCWTPNGATMGGTATAIRLAEMHRIPVTNLAREEFKL